MPPPTSGRCIITAGQSHSGQPLNCFRRLQKLALRCIMDTNRNHNPNWTSSGLPQKSTKTRICAAEMAVRYAALSACGKVHVCHCNSLGGATWRSVMITGRTDRQADRQTATQYAAPPREEGRIKTPQTDANSAR